MKRSSLPAARLLSSSISSHRSCKAPPEKKRGLLPAVPSPPRTHFTGCTVGMLFPDFSAFAVRAAWLSASAPD
jgi:hypothetical protein